MELIFNLFRVQLVYEKATRITVAFELASISTYHEGPIDDNGALLDVYLSWNKWEGSDTSFDLLYWNILRRRLTDKLDDYFATSPPMTRWYNRLIHWFWYVIDPYRKR